VRLDLPGALKRMDTRKARVFWMRQRNPLPEDPMDLFDRASRHQHRNPTEFLREVEVIAAELATYVLD
jgi:hypothetical protein